MAAVMKVLVADDAVDVVKLLTCSLTVQGYEVSVAYDGAQALEVASAERPDVILLDIAMPKIDGLEVCRRLKADEQLASIPVIMLTGRDSQEDVVAGLDAGANDYIIKPFNNRILSARLRSATRVKSSHDTIARMNSQLREEIAHRMKAEQETTAARQRIEFILGATKTGLAIVDSNYKLVYVDPQWQQHYGVLDGKACYQYFRGKTQPCENCALRRAMSTKTVIVGEGVMPKEGNRPVQMSCIPFQDEQGQWFYAEVNVDISDRKVLERELAQAQKLEAIGHLAAGIAHEINTPTQYIGDNTRFLKDAFADLDKALKAVDHLLETAEDGVASAELLDGTRAALQEADIEYLNKEIPLAIRQSLEGVGRVASIVRAMKEFSHPGFGRKQVVNLNHAIENTLTVSRNEWKYVAELVTDLDPDLPPVACLPSDLNQVILNVVVNAAQAIEDVIRGGTGPKGTITVSTRRDGHDVEIRIADTGSGIPEDLRSKVFDPFFTTKEVGKGTGQGLSIAHSIVTEKHGGTISFETEPGRGTTFIIRLPITDDSHSRKIADSCQQIPDRRAIGNTRRDRVAEQPPASAGGYRR